MGKVYDAAICKQCGVPCYPFHIHYQDRQTPPTDYTCQRCREPWHGIEFQGRGGYGRKNLRGKKVKGDE